MQICREKNELAVSRNCKRAEEPFGRWVEHSRFGQTCHSFRSYSENNGNIWWVYGRLIILTQVGTGWKWVYWRIHGVSPEENTRNSIASGKRIRWSGGWGRECYVMERSISGAGVMISLQETRLEGCATCERRWSLNSGKWGCRYVSDQTGTVAQ